MAENKIFAIVRWDSLRYLLQIRQSGLILIHIEDLTSGNSLTVGESFALESMVLSNEP